MIIKKWKSVIFIVPKDILEKNILWTRSLPSFSSFRGPGMESKTKEIIGIGNNLSQRKKDIEKESC